MKIALVHDYLKGEGGAEQVLLALHEIYPTAPIYTIFSSIKNSSTLAEKFKKAKIIESWFGKLPYKERLISPLRFLIPLIWSSFDFSSYDLVITSASWAITKGLTKGGTKEICYCHTPPRYLYGYETSRDWQKKWWVRIYALLVNHFMRIYDFNQSQKVAYFIANSREVQGRIKKFYRRDSVVINPPVEIPKGLEGLERFKGRKYFLTGGRLEKPKNFDLIIEACNKLEVSLKIYGVGPQMDHLKKLSGPSIEFLGPVDDEEKFKLFADAKAFIAMARDEDFGITPVEAMAVGTPVIAYKGGGYLETVVEGKTGIFVKEATTEELVSAIRNFENVGAKIKPEDCRKQAEKFSKERFKKEVTKFVEENA